jgi:hypothetical protein
MLSDSGYLHIGLSIPERGLSKLEMSNKSDE